MRISVLKLGDIKLKKTVIICFIFLPQTFLTTIKNDKIKNSKESDVYVYICMYVCIYLKKLKNFIYHNKLRYYYKFYSM